MRAWQGYYGFSTANHRLMMYDADVAIPSVTVAASLEQDIIVARAEEQFEKNGRRRVCSHFDEFDLMDGRIRVEVRDSRAHAQEPRQRLCLYLVGLDADGLDVFCTKLTHICDIGNSEDERHVVFFVSLQLKRRE